jgi:hypothetical protein
MRRLSGAACAAALLASAPARAQEAGDEMQGHDMSEMPGMETNPPVGDHSARHTAQTPGMAGALGGYPSTREASGTAWQADASPHEGLHLMSGPWMLMAHATLNGVYDWQGGRRGDQQGFVSGMAMGMARRDFGAADTLQLRAMLSPDPFMGKRGYPLLLAAGETADGTTPLIDRQHPHDLVMELSASVAHRFGARDSMFLYLGLPGEPAFGPPAFMHRLSIQDSPEAPISHHWLDSTHITFGVATAGVVHGGWKLEASAFKGREPDQHRYDIEPPKLDSYAARISWNPTQNWSLQTSWAHLKSPEQLSPEENQTRWSASAIYTVPVGAVGWWSTTAAWGRRSTDHDDLDALVLESAVKPNAGWTVFARAERIETNDLAPLGDHHGPVYAVGKVSAGAVHDWAAGQHVSLGLGGLVSVNFAPGALTSAYGDRPAGGMAFVRLKLR